MTTPLSIVTGEPVAPTAVPAAGGRAPDAKPRAPAPPAPPPTRLMIEEIGNTGRFVYKVLNPLTGEVIMQLPREEIVRLSELDSYASGAMLNTQA